MRVVVQMFKQDDDHDESNSSCAVDGRAAADRITRRNLLHKKVEALHEELQCRSPEMFERLSMRRTTFKRVPAPPPPPPPPRAE